MDDEDLLASLAADDDFDVPAEDGDAEESEPMVKTPVAAKMYTPPAPAVYTPPPAVRVSQEETARRWTSELATRIAEQQQLTSVVRDESLDDSLWSDQDASRSRMSFTERMAEARRRAAIAPETPVAARKPPVPAKAFARPTAASSSTVPAPAPAPAAVDPKECVERFSGLRLRDRQVSAADMAARMEGRQFVRLSQVREAASRQSTLPGAAQKQLVFIGVISEKRPPKTSRNNETFVTWRLCDLADSTVTLLLFGGAQETHWKLSVGTVVALLDPKILPVDAKQTTSLATLSISTADRLLVLGTAMDMGVCRGIRKDGSKCGALIDVREGPFCSFHVASAYKQAKQQRLVLGGGATRTVKEVTEAAAARSKGDGERAWTGDTASLPGRLVPIPQQKGMMLKGDGSVIALADVKAEEERARLASKAQLQHFLSKNKHILLNARPGTELLLGETAMSREERAAAEERRRRVEATVSRQLGYSPDAPASAGFSIPKRPLMDIVPTLTRPVGGDVVVLDDDTRMSTKVLTQLEAARILAQKKVALAPEDPNKLPAPRPVTPESLAALKRKAAANAPTSPSKRQRTSLLADVRAGGALDDAARAALLEARGRHAELLEDVAQDGEQRRLAALAEREKMFNKMLSIEYIEVDAFYCKECDMRREVCPKFCREGGHTVEKVRAKKRFFECDDCEARTTSLYSTPRHTCERCGSKRFKKAGMVKDTSGQRVSSLTLRGEHHPDYVK